MSTNPHTMPGDADVSIRIGKSIALDASITSRGLLSVAALVSAILLSTAAIVATAKRKAIDRGSPKLAPPKDG